ncbi:2966_t:CDS:1, partial [Acaulospora morrowiae]
KASQEEQNEEENRKKEKKKQQVQYQDAEEMNTEEDKTPLTTYKAINDEVVERQDKIEKQIEHMRRMLSDLLENSQSAITKKRQQPQRQ